MLENTRKNVTIHSSKFNSLLPSENPVNPKSNDSTKYLFKLFRILGITSSGRLFLLINISLTMVVPLTFALSFLMSSEKMDIGRILTSLQICIIIFACVLKFTIIGLLRSYLFKTEGILDKLDARIISPSEVHEVETNIKMGQRIFMFFTFVYFSYSTSTCLGAVFSGVPPYSLYNPFLNWRKSKRNFIIQSVLEYLLVNVSTVQNIMNDSYAVIYIGMVHMHLKILIMRVLRIGQNPGWTGENNLRELKLCIRDHQNIDELICTISPVISCTVFVQFMISATALGVCLINIAIFGNTSSIAGSALFITGVVTETLPICYSVTKLVEQSEHLPEAIFHMNWVDQSLVFRRICIFFMHRSQRSLVLFAGKMFPITLRSFVSIIKFSFSLYTLFSKMDFGEKLN